MDKVSTHASREGRDLSPSLRLTWLSCFNSCAPQRTRLVLRDKPDNASQFQLTRPAKDATRALVFGAVQALVSTHASREERDHKALAILHALRVSTHASREGRDNLKSHARAAASVSTHASREGRDDISRIHRYDNTQRPRLRGGVGLMGLCGAKRGNLQALCGARTFGDFCVSLGLARLFCISVGGLRLQASDASIWHSVNFFKFAAPARGRFS